MPDNRAFNSIIRGLRDDVDDLAKLTVRKYRRDAAKDARKALTSMKKDLKRWSDLLEKGLLTTDDFEFLVNSQQDSVKMTALKNSGLGLVRMDQFKFAFFNMVIDVMFDAVLGTESYI